MTAEALLALPLPLVPAARRRYAVPSVTRHAILRAVRNGLALLRAVPHQRLADWAAEHFRLSGDSSHRPGEWRAWPIQLAWLDAFSNDDIEQVDVQKAKRWGYTKCLVAFIAYNAAHRNRKQVLWQPTDDDRDSFVKSEVDPMLSEVAAVHAARRMSKGAEDTIKYKTFRGSVAHFLGGKAARAYRRITVSVAMLDEIDAFDQQIEKSADPVTLARGRLEGAPFPKLICGSTPRIKGLSHVERQASQADVRMVYQIPCIHCQVEHPLLWGDEHVPYGIKWRPADPATAHHVCPHCLGAISQADYLSVWHQGAWVCERTGTRYGADRTWRASNGDAIRAPRHVAFVDAWAAYSPQREWSDIVREFLAAKTAAAAGDTGPLQGWVNETRAQTWEVVGERTEENALEQRAKSEHPPFALRTVPRGCLSLTAGIDVQGNRWEIAVWGWGRGLESWTIDHAVIEGNPADDRDWDQVEAYLRRRYTQDWHGGTLGVEMVSIDSGHHTQPVYNWVRLAQARMRVCAVKGASEEGRPIKGTASPQEVNWRGQRWPQGVKVWLIGVDTAKDLLHGQLSIARPGPGYVHMSHQLPREWFEQLTAEQRIPVRSATGDSYKWVKRRPRNEVLDCRNYALHAAYMLGLHQYTDRDWARLESVVQPPPDLFTLAGGAIVADAPAEAPAARQPPPSPISLQPQPRRAPTSVPRSW